MGNSMPSFKKIKEYIYSQIKTQALIPDDQLPSQKELMDLFKVSRGTVHKAIADLIEEGIIYGVHGLGNFVSNPNATQTITRVTKDKSLKAIGFIIPYDYHFTPELLNGIEHYFSQRQYRLVVCNTDSNPDKEEQLIQQLVSEGIQGLIIYTSFNEKYHTPLINLQKTGFPFVIISSHISNFPCDFVVSNNVNGGYLAGKHLCELGHPSIIAITWTEMLEKATVKERLIGFKRALGESSIPFNDKSIFGCTMEEFQNRHHRPSTGTFYSPLKKPLLQALEANKNVSAIFCINDVIALEILRVLEHLNIRVPENLSIIGFDDNAFVTHLPVPLTTVRQDFYEIGRKAAEIILSKLENPTESFNSVYLPVRLIARKSTMAWEKPIQNKKKTVE